MSVYQKVSFTLLVILKLLYILLLDPFLRDLREYVQESFEFFKGLLVRCPWVIELRRI
jgi:hypothetical protein